MTGLDPVHVLGLGFVQELDRRPTRFEHDDASVVRAPVGDLLEPQRIAIKAKRLVEVRDRQGNA